MAPAVNEMATVVYAKKCFRELSNIKNFAKENFFLICGT